MTGRLIDADELKATFGISGDETSCRNCKYLGFCGCREETPISDVCCFIDDAPTVDAIPVEYILKRMDEMNDFITEWRGVAEKKTLIDSYVHDVCALARLVYGWRKDNGQTD